MVYNKKRFVKGTSKARELIQDLNEVKTDYRYLRVDWSQIGTTERAYMLFQVLSAISVIRSQAIVFASLYPDNGDFSDILKHVDFMATELGRLAASDGLEVEKLVSALRKAFSKELRSVRGFGILSSIHMPG